MIGWTNQRRGQKYKMFSSLCLFSEWHTAYCDVHVGGRLFMSWGLYVSLWRSSCPTLNADDGQKSLLKPVRAIGQQIYIKNRMWESWQTIQRLHKLSFICEIHLLQIFFKRHVQIWCNTKMRLHWTHATEPEQTFNALLQSYSKFLLPHKDRPSVECGVSSR